MSNKIAVLKREEGIGRPLGLSHSGVTEGYQQKSNQACDRAGECVAQIIWKEAGNKLREYFDSITVEQLCRMAQDMGLRREPGS
jgi:DNA-binding IscR family transcriptional regulator